MKIRVNLTVDINPDSWELISGIGKDEMREDVRSWAAHIVGEQIRYSTGDESVRVTLAK